jgi:DNA-binding transcriptional LysR family regulator
MLELIATFAKIVEQGSLTKAARALGQPKSRVSRKLAALEKELGVPLMDRTSRQLSLTEAGRRLYDKARAHVAGLEEAVRDVADDPDEPQGTLRVTTLPDIGAALFGELVAELTTMYPRLTVELDFAEDFVDLVKTGTDLALRVGRLTDASLKAKRIGQVQFILVASPGYLARAPRLAKPEDLAAHAALAFTSMSLRDRWRLIGVTAKIKPVVRVNNPKVLLELAIAGRGVAALPEFHCADALRRGELVRVLPQLGSQPKPVQFVWPATRGTPSAKVKAFVALGAERLRPYFT